MTARIDNVSVDALTTMIDLGLQAAIDGFGTPSNTIYTAFTATVEANGAEKVLHPWLVGFKSMEQWDSEKSFQELILREYATTHEPWHVGAHAKREEIRKWINLMGVQGFVDMFTRKLAMQAAQQHQKQVNALLTGNTKLGYDAKALFASDHPDGGGQSNQDTGGGGQYHYFLDLSGPARPVILQDGQVDGGGFILKDHVSPDTTENFMQRKLYWSIEGWFGYHVGMWQTIYRSNQTLNETEIDAKTQAMAALKDYHGDELGMNPTHVLVGRSKYLAARKALNATIIPEKDSGLASGAMTAVDNVQQGQLQIIYDPRLP